MKSAAVVFIKRTISLRLPTLAGKANAGKQCFHCAELGFKGFAIVEKLLKCRPALYAIYIIAIFYLQFS